MTWSAARRPALLSAVVLAFALVSVLWFGVGFAALAQGIADGSMRDRTHVVFGYAAAAVAGATVAGWLWALATSARAGSPVNGPVRVMCGATAATQFATVLAMAVLMGGSYWDEPAGFLVGHAAIAALLAVLIGLSRSRAAAGSNNP